MEHSRGVKCRKNDNDAPIFCGFEKLGSKKRLIKDGVNHEM